MWEDLSDPLPESGRPLNRAAEAEPVRLACHKGGRNDSGAVAEHPPLFAGISPGDCTRIIAGARTKRFERHETLHFIGDSVQSVTLLTSGLAKVTRLGLGGMEVILRLAAPGDVLGAACLLSTGKHGATIQAFRACSGMAWDARAFKALVQCFPVLQQNVARILGQNLRELEQRFREVATENVGQRVARQLARLQNQIGQRVNGGVEVGISREELAQMTGTTLFTVSRLLSAWEARGVVGPRRESVTIYDGQALCAMCEEDHPIFRTRATAEGPTNAGRGSRRGRRREPDDPGNGGPRNPELIATPHND